MALQSARNVALASASAAFIVVRWSLGLLLLGVALSVSGAALLWDEGWGALRTGGWSTVWAGLGAVVLLLSPALWWWLGNAQGVNKALLRVLGPHAGDALNVLFDAIEQRSPGQALNAPGLLAILRHPGQLGGLAGWIVRALSWRLDLDRTAEHLEAAMAAPGASEQPPRRVLSTALAADLGERWLPGYGWLIWLALLLEVTLLIALGWG